MGLTFGNPAALWALAAIPLVLLIHFLQRETRRESVSTLFLIERFTHESRKGRRFERLRHSKSLWLQILAVLLIAWLLAEPRRMHADSVQRVAVVLDDSVSLRAFVDPDDAPLARTLAGELRRLERGAAETEWMLLTSSAQRGALYSGVERHELLARADQWRPRAGLHDAGPVLREAIAATLPGGAVLFVTDRRRPDIPDGVEVIGLGEPFANVGFTGLRVEQRDEQLIWRALVRNYGDQPQSRSWWVEFGEGQTEPRDLELGPGGTVSVSGAFPEESDRAVLVLSPGRFSLDDRLPMIRPRTKTLLRAPEVESPLADSLSAFLDSLPGWRPAGPGETPDFRFAALPAHEEPQGPGVFFRYADEPPAPNNATIFSERHRLTENLSWQGLDATSPGARDLQPEETPLLWQGAAPLVLLREARGEDQLLVEFDLRHANASRLPAFIVLLHRFLEDLRRDKPAHTRENVHTTQRLNLAVDPLGPEVVLQTADGTEERVPPGRAGFLRAPDQPGFFSVRQGEQPLLDAAAHFADARTADFREAETFIVRADRERQRQQADRHSRRDFLAPLWMLLLGGVLLLNWRYSDSET